MTPAVGARPRAGQHWALRPGRTYGPTPVEVVVKAVDGSRVRVSRVAGVDAGKLVWVPSRTLHVPWAQVESWQWDEQRAHALRAANTRRAFDDPEYIAISLVLSVLGGVETSQMTPLTCRLVEHNQSLAQWVPSLLTQTGTFVDRLGDLHGGWAAAVQLSRIACQVAPTAVVAALQSETELAERAAITGLRPGRINVAREADIVTHRTYLYGPYAAAVTIVSDWLGSDVSRRFDELVALRAEVTRLGRLVESAAVHLRDAGRRAVAEALVTELGALPQNRLDDPRAGY